MIITCEQCHARYLLASLLLGASGRKVRCGACGHMWFQDQVDEIYEKPADHAAPTDGIDISFSDHLDAEILEPIPEIIQPIPEGSSVPAVNGAPVSLISFLTSRESLNGILTAMAIVAVIAAGLLVMRVPVVGVWAPSALVFEKMKIPVPVPGAGLIFDRVTAKAVPDEAGHYTLTLSGNVINLKAEATKMPSIRATLRESEAQPGDSWIVVMDEAVIEAEETVPFTSTYENLPDVMKEVNIQFVLE